MPRRARHECGRGGLGYTGELARIGVIIIGLLRSRGLRSRPYRHGDRRTSVAVAAQATPVSSQEETMQTHDCFGRGACVLDPTVTATDARAWLSPRRQPRLVRKRKRCKPTIASVAGPASSTQLSRRARHERGRRRAGNTGLFARGNDANPRLLRSRGLPRNDR